MKHALLETITASLVTLIFTRLERTESQLINNGDVKCKNEVNINEELFTKVVSIFSKNPICVCMNRRMCSNVPNDPRGVGLFQPRSRNEGSCKRASDYCCPVSCPALKDKAGNSQMSHMCGMRVPGGSGGSDLFMPGDAARSSGHGEFPWMAAILTLEDGQKYFQCGASLIHRQVVLTAAHCVINREETYLVRLGEYNPLAEDETWLHEDLDVLKTVHHPDYYSGALYNDIALVILKDPVSFKSHIQPICLPTQGESVEKDKQCYVTGWGTDLQGNTGIFSNVLESVRLNIVSHDTCEQAFKNSNRLGSKFKLSHTFLCAGGEGADSCKGDGGGPLVCKIPGERRRYRQVGIVSWGIGCGRFPGAYTNVPLYVTWINQQLTNHNLTYSPTFYVDEKNLPVPKY